MNKFRMKDTEKRLEFVSFCIENYASSHEVSGADTQSLFQRSGVDVFLYDNYIALHSQGKEWLLAEIERFLQEKKAQ